MNRKETRERLLALGIPAERLPENGPFDLSGAVLSRADLSGANLSGADLTRANLTRADLSGANLSEANLSETDLLRADLSGAVLSRADLSGADLSGAVLSRADLSGANLSGADLTRADLSGAIGPFSTGSFSRHNAIAAGGHIAIGYERHTYEEWLAQGEKIGREHGYTADEINDYMQWIRLAVVRQQRIESQQPGLK